MTESDSSTNDIPVKRMKRSLNIIEFLRERVIESYPGYKQPFRHAAAIVDGTRIVGWGQNTSKTTPQLRRFGKWPTMHAEISACKHNRNFNFEKLKGKDAYVIRVRSNGKLGLSKPCSMCEAFLRSIGIKRLFYSDNNENILMETLT